MKLVSPTGLLGRFALVVVFLTIPIIDAIESTTDPSLDIFSQELNRVRDNVVEEVKNTTTTSTISDDTAISQTALVDTPTWEPTTGCEDSTLSFLVGGKKRKCAWVAFKKKRCNFLNGQVGVFCPQTCDRCNIHACKNPKRKFYVGGTLRDCTWVKARRKRRCKFWGVSSTCRWMCNPICKFPVIDDVGNPCTDKFGAGSCEACTGDCDRDSDCKGNLRCGNRYSSTDEVQNVPGCRWGKDSGDLQEDGTDYCFMPTSQPGEVNYVGECGSNYECGECEGDCDGSGTCGEGLKCMEREGFEIVPGCSGAGGIWDVYGKDMCYKPIEVQLLGGTCNNFFETGFCEVCTGDCDQDSDCDGNLRCAQRRGNKAEVENVPGCEWGEGSGDIQTGGSDFCFMPEPKPNGVVNYVGECGSEDYLCGECEGDCDGDETCEEGLECMSRSGYEDVPGCSGAGGSRDLFGKDVCFRPNTVEFLDSLRNTGDGTRCAGPCTNDNDCDGPLQCFERNGSEYVPGCVTGGEGDISGMNYCHKAPPNGNPTYIPGSLTVSENGLELSTGLSSRIIARSGQTVQYDTGGSSSEVFHRRPDGAAVFSVTSGPNAGGWVYASNAEVSSGGVGAITFDSDGNVIGYETVLTGTTWNCGGGKTYWGTWVTCEENGFSGQVHEVDPVIGLSTQQETVIGGTGGQYEAFAYDARDRLNPTFYVTNDHPEGGTVRFTPDSATVAAAEDSGDYSNVLTTPGTLEWLVLSPENGSRSDPKGTFRWTSNRSEGDDNAYDFYRNAEGIDIRNGFLYMTTKVWKYLFILDLDNLTYERSSTVSGAFEGQPDQVASIIAQDPKRDMLYFCEESSNINNGVHARDSDGYFYTILNGPGLSSETTGLAFSPDNIRMYVSYQGDGKIFEITRDDGYPFGAHRLDIKYHA